MNKKQAIEATIKHWVKMIRWGKKQNPKKKYNPSHMLSSINTAVGSVHCELCKKYSCCFGCPLYNHFGICSSEYSKNLFYDVPRSKTWGTWVKNSEKFLIQLKSLK